jgi:hypothetical protein
MKALRLVASAFLVAASSVRADPPPYIGQWSNGRGETMKITAKTIQFADNKPIPFRDLTEARSENADERTFELQITARGNVNAFPGKTLALTCQGDSLHVVGYLSHQDLSARRNPQMIVHWERDSED